MRNLGILCVTLFASSCSFLFSPDSGADRDGGTPATDGGMPAIDGSSPPGDATVADAMVVDASTAIQIVPTGALSPSLPLGDITAGKDFPPVSCPGSSVIYGIKASTYSPEGRLCRIQILCATLEIDADGVKRIDDPVGIPINGVGSCNTDLSVVAAGSTTCPGESVATGIYLSQYTTTDNEEVFYNVRLACSNVSDTAMVSLTTTRSPLIGSPAPVGPLPQEFSSLCIPAVGTNTVATRLTGRARESINSIGLSCQTLLVQEP